MWGTPTEGHTSLAEKPCRFSVDYSFGQGKWVRFKRSEGFCLGLIPAGFRGVGVSPWDLALTLDGLS